MIACTHSHSVADCLNGKCQQTGVCQDLPQVVSPSIAPAMDSAFASHQVSVSSIAPSAFTVTADKFEVQAAAPSRQRLIETDSAARKTYPMAIGLLDYFPDALAEVARLSFLGNQKHNPGEPMHHARGKSTDHADCIVRHLVGRGGFDGDVRESAALAWRALALLQEEIEKELNLPLPRGARD